MSEASWIIRDAIGRTLTEYGLSYAELCAIIAEELSSQARLQLESEWHE